jgi:predicted HicB family RNase H-like nuclease
MTKMGRPKKAAKERSSHLIALRLTPAEHKALEQAAEKSKLSISNYIRAKLGLRGDK